jgi:hypothetical protein
MVDREDDFLPTAIGILTRLQAITVQRGRTNLAFLLDLARTEAEDELRYDRAEAELKSTLSRRRAAQTGGNSAGSLLTYP